MVLVLIPIPSSPCHMHSLYMACLSSLFTHRYSFLAVSCFYTHHARTRLPLVFVVQPGFNFCIALREQRRRRRRAQAFEQTSWFVLKNVHLTFRIFGLALVLDRIRTCLLFVARVWFDIAPRGFCLLRFAGGMRFGATWFTTRARCTPLQHTRYVAGYSRVCMQTIFVCSPHAHAPCAFYLCGHRFSNDV